MEAKWFAIVMIVLFAGMFVGVSIETHHRQQCRIAAIQAGMPAEQIEKVCR